MNLIDTSLWIEHVHAADGRLLSLLGGRDVLTHPFVIGEVALGHVRQRQTVLAALQRLRRVKVCSDSEVFQFIARHRLAGSGVGYVDAHLLASTMLSNDCFLWTLDKRLHAVAQRLGVAAVFS